MNFPETKRPDVEETNNDSNRSHPDLPPEHHKRRPKRRHRQRKKRSDVEKTNNSTGVPPELPPELHEIIIDELEGEEDALKQCALTCRFYRHLAQRLLFKSVELPFADNYDLAYNFLKILDASPHIGDYVKSVSSSYVWRRCNYKSATFNQSLAAQTQAQPENPLSLVLPTLINVDNLAVRRTTDIRYDFPRSSQFMAKCESLLSLTLFNVRDVPLEIFNHLQRLEKLKLEVVYFLSDSADKHVMKINPCQLKHMELFDVHIQRDSIYPFFMARKFGFGGLESFTICIIRFGSIAKSLPVFEAAKLLIRSNSASLKVLDVMITGNEPVILPNDQPVFDVSKMPLLEEWTLGGVFRLGGGTVEAVLVSLGWLSRHLETIPAGKRFKSITLRPEMCGVSKLMDIEWDVESLKYFENLIVEKVLPSTESFSINFHILAYIGYQEPAKQLLRKLLPTLYELNLMKFIDYD
ncbi:hypothetical protein CPC08DRAFT_716230 [Agrocybe pediades]|nr:hypothetical protein CPC08DRAFT_716230 [Agrocybe pediades]